MTNKTVEQVRKDFVERSNKAKAESYKAHAINSLTPAQKEGVKLLSQVSDIVGGPQELNKLVSAFNFIMNSK